MLTYSRSLRAIGQSLESLGLSEFELEARAQDYVVRPVARERQNTGRLLAWIAQRLGKRNQEQSDSRLVFGPAKVVWLDFQGQLQVGKADGIPDHYRTSHVMRVIGDHLDRRQARPLKLKLVSNHAQVTYERSGGRLEEQSFTVDELYNRAVHMYLRRRRKAAT